MMEPWGNPDLEAREKKGKYWGNIIKNEIPSQPRTSPQRQKRKKTVLLLNKH